MNWAIEKIIHVAKDLKIQGYTSASTSEQIAAAFVLNDMDYLPNGYKDVIDAWERLDDWQHLVKQIKSDYRHLID